MNHLPHPQHDDNNTLDQLGMTNYRDDLLLLGLIRAAYNNYQNINGNAGNAPAPLTLPDAFTKKFKGLYESGRVELAYIKELRNAALACCPMCGSFSLGTLDHVFPQSLFPEFAIYSRNLVPCCHDCNGKRQNTYSNNNGGRVLHPYFDVFLGQRLLYTEISSPDNFYERPTLTVTALNPAHPNATEIQFHIDEVVKNTQILVRQITIWTDLMTDPTIYLDSIPRDIMAIDAALDARINKFDREFKSQNNWKSMLFYGLQQSVGAKNYLLNFWSARDDI